MNSYLKKNLVSSSEPIGDWCYRSLHNDTSDQTSLKFISLSDMNVFRTKPVGFVATFFTNIYPL